MIGCAQSALRRTLPERLIFRKRILLSVAAGASPKLYMGCGVSGALHHIMGMDTAKVIVAVNKDPNAPIFQYADYGIVEDLFSFLPAFKEELKIAKEKV